VAVALGARVLVHELDRLGTVVAHERMSGALTVALDDPASCLQALGRERVHVGRGQLAVVDPRVIEQLGALLRRGASRCS
jgi:hypothetical protein